MPGRTRRSGRQSNEVRTRAASLVEKGKLLEMVQAIALNGAAKAADRINAAKLLMSYGYGQPAQQVDVTSGGKPLLVLGTP